MSDTKVDVKVTFTSEDKGTIKVDLYDVKLMLHKGTMVVAGHPAPEVPKELLDNA
jgi:hypothetical protein